MTLKMPSARALSVHMAPPAMGTGAGVVDRKVDRHRDGHRHHPGADRQEKAAAFPQIPQIEFGASLQTDQQKEEGHQSVVDPATQVQDQPAAAQAEAQLLFPCRPVQGREGVGPGQGG
nr:hypothetical protein [Streptomyces glomeratus]